MSDASATSQPKAKISPLAVLGTIAGVLLFIYTLQTAGPARIVAQLRQIGAGFLVVLLLSGVRMAVRAKAWSLCLGPAERLSFGQAFRAFVSGDAVGNITPFGPLASESTKALLSRRTIPTSAAFSSVVLENIFYSISVAIVVALGTVAFLLGYRPTDAALTITLALATIALASLGVVWWLLSSQPRLLSRFLTHSAVREAEERVFRFASGSRARIGEILLMEFVFHLSTVLEIAFLLTLLVGYSHKTLLDALILGTVERLITIAFKFVPLRLGVDHVGAGSMAGILGLGMATGITIATARTARNLFWAGVGMTLLLRLKTDTARSG